MISAIGPVGLHPPAPRRALTLALAALVCLVLLPAMTARADTPSTLTVVGTSDVQDSGLVPDLITPGFEKAFPKYTLNYVAEGTGAAISAAEAGTASALIVHAASLENQFVAQGYSKEPFGRAVFYGDYVLLGPASDPAGVLTSAPHDIVGALAKIAAAGAAGQADYVSRANTSGTAVQEHLIWALDAGTPGLTLCPVSAANGGGDAPSSTGSCGATPAYPSWYHPTGVEQAANIEIANTCNFANAAANHANDCYVFTDRGTFQCLISAACAGTSAAPTNLKIVTRDNSAIAKGGDTELINSFHAYAINPAKFAGNPNVQINSTAAEDLLNYLTSPTFQSELKSYLGSTNGPPFIADAAPNITVGKFPKQVTGGQRITVRGSIANAVPGTPPLAGKTVSVTEVVSGVAAGIPIASAKTSPTGAYSIAFSPPNTGSYQVTTGQITQIENSALSPAFEDLLQPGASSAAKITVAGSIQGLGVKALPGRVLVTGSVLPGTGPVKGSIELLAHSGGTGSFKRIASSSLGSLDRSFAISAALKTGTWSVEVRFQDPGQVVSNTTKPKQVSVPAPDAASVTIGSLKIKNGRFTLSGKIDPKPGASGTTVQVLGLDVGAIAVAQPGARIRGTAASAAVRFRVVAKLKLSAGATKFTVHGTLKRGQRWILELQYATGGGAGSAYGGLRAVRVT
jgi:tungstate transport system substrate-binding protein